MRFSPWFLVSLILAILGALFYVGMGLVHGDWMDRGVYTIAVVLLLFGIGGMWLARAEAAEADRS